MADVALGAFGHVLGFRDDGLEGFLAHHHVVALEEHDAGGEAVALGVDHGDRLAAVVDPGQHRERGAQVDADGGSGRLSHNISTLVPSPFGRWVRGEGPRRFHTLEALTLALSRREGMLRLSDLPRQLEFVGAKQMEDPITDTTRPVRQ